MVNADGPAAAISCRRQWQHVSVLGGVDQDLALQGESTLGNNSSHGVPVRKNPHYAVLEIKINMPFTSRVRIDFGNHLAQDLADG